MAIEKPKACLPGNCRSKFQGNTRALSRRSLHNGLQIIPENGDLQSRRPPPLHVVIALMGPIDQRLHNVAPVEGPPKPSQSVQGLRHTDSTGFLQQILVRYLKFKRDDGGRQEEYFVNLVHLAICESQLCECERIRDLILHFDRCQKIHCQLCQPVRLMEKNSSGAASDQPLSVVMGITSESENPNGYVSRDYVVQDMQPPPKRMKMADSKEASTSSVIEGGSMSLRKFDGRHTNSAAVNVVHESTRNLGNSLQTVGDEAVDLQDLGWVETDRNCVLPSVADLGKSCQTFDEIALDLDNFFRGEQEMGSDKNSPIDGESSKPRSQSEHNRIDDAEHDLANPESQCRKKLDDLKASSVSLVDFFTAEQIEQHLSSLKQDINLESSSSITASNNCQLCGLDDIMFTAVNMFCASCEARIKKNSTYYGAKEHLPITPASGAQDLPRTKLSDHIEQRLCRSLERERKQRAQLVGKKPEDVPGVSDLTVRVVLDVKRQLRVNQKFLDFLHDETYPTEFPYKLKAILLFQKVEGVDVCLFALYVQEYGSECGNPNKRSIYISYLDSVKYFRPEIRSVAGVALRTFVYHEILIGYLDYCKRLGFQTCYIWSCPSLKGDDYILHCHPESQKRPHPDKLVQWYKKMLKKAKEKNVVVGFTNFFDHFFVQNEDSNSKMTAARLPYLDGDFWPRAIEDLMQSVEKDNVGDSVKKRSVKAMGHNYPSNEAKDIQLMHKLKDIIMRVKDEFIVINLQFTCTECREAILSGSCWSCNHCSKYHLCSRCHYELELSSNSLNTHTATCGNKHQLIERPVDEVAGDKDVLLDSDIFKDRHSLLNFCEKNFFRFDTLRRAKHSSMMIVDHLLAATGTMQHL